MYREKVIKGLEYCEEYFNCCDKCPYWDGGTHCSADLARDALALLKEQEDLGTELGNAVELIHKKNERIEQLNRFVNGFSRDAMPVVRCKDCKYHAMDMCCNHPIEWNNGESRNHCNPNWFCADGEKRT